MAARKDDIEMYAARIRPHFEPALREDAYELALELARSLGAKVKELRPETSLGEILQWFAAAESAGASLDVIDWLMTVEIETDMDLGLFEDRGPSFERIRFHALVCQRARRRCAA